MEKNNKDNYRLDEIGDSLKTIVSAATNSLGDGLKTVSERLTNQSGNKNNRIYSPRAVKRMQRNIRQKRDRSIVLMLFCGFFSLILVWTEGIEGIVYGSVFFFGLIAGIILYRNSKKERKQLDRFQLYCNLLEIDEACKIDRLSELTGLSESETIIDLTSLISKGVFVSPHLDVEHKMMYGTEEKYRQSTLPPTPEKLKEAKDAQGNQETVKKYPVEVQGFITEISDFLKRIQLYTKEIKNQKVVSQLDYMDIIMTKICDQIKKDPENLDDTSRMRKYYLPTTIKLLDTYQELMAGDIKVDSLEGSKKEIEEVLVTLNEFYTQLYEDMCQGTSMDIHSDISVLNALLKQDGFTDKNDITGRRELS